MLTFVSFDGLSVAFSYLLSLAVKVILWAILCKALEPRSSDGQWYMWGNYH